MKDASKFFYIVLSIFFIIFIFIFISSKTGYYEYSNNNKKNFTEEMMVKFEEDVKNGKNVKIEDYLDNKTVNYENNITKLGDDVSLVINKSINFLLEVSFKAVEKIID